MIGFVDNNGNLRRVTEYTMDAWNGEEWVTVEDYSSEEYWDSFTFEEFLEYLDSLPEPNEPDPHDDEHYQGPWPMSIERKSDFYSGGSYK